MIADPLQADRQVADDRQADGFVTIQDSCPLRNNTLIGGSSAADRKLTPAQKKSAEAVRLEFESLIKCVGIAPLLFVTVTFPNPIPSRSDRELIYDKIKQSILVRNFIYGFSVFDRSPTGRPHFHVIGVGAPKTNYRAGFDFGVWAESSGYEQQWNRPGHTDHFAEQQWRAATERYTASASRDLKQAWSFLAEQAAQHGFGRINALPIKDPIACGFYLAKCITNGFREQHPDDHSVRRVRFWGKFPRKVSLKFHRVTERSTRWRGKLAFCAHILGLDDLEDFAKCFGPRWFLYLRGIIRLVPNRVAEMSLLTPHIRLDLDEWEQRRVQKVEVELHDRLERYGLGGRGNSVQQTNTEK